MIGAGAFAVALSLAGYVLGGWLWAVALPVVFLAVLPPLNWLVIAKAPEQWNSIVAFQAAKWSLFAVLIALMLALRYAFL